MTTARHQETPRAPRLYVSRAGGWLLAGLLFGAGVHLPPAKAATYEVSTNGPLYNLAEVPWHTLGAGDTVLIHWRSSPYYEKWVICRQGTSQAPITIRGVPNGEGALPVIDGFSATTPTPLNYWGEQRGVIKIGGANTPADTTPEHILIENLEVRGARPPYQYVGDDRTTNTYAENAAAIYVEKGRHITIRNCVLSDCGNGLFVGAYEGVTSNLLIEECRIFNNGISNSIYEHNIYTEACGITFQHNQLGALRQGCLGNNLKDRSAGTVIRYNRIENGNRQLDLVDSETLSHLPLYSNTFVYGNLLMESTNNGNNQIVHYGGDSGIMAQYRKGCLHFFNNTVVSKRSDRTTLFRLSSQEEQAECGGNILYVTLSGNTLAMLDDTGILRLRDNWTKPGWVGSHGSLSGSISNLGGQITGSAPGFRSEGSGDYRLADGSACVDAHTNSPAIEPDYDGVPRPLDGNADGVAHADIGAFEFMHPTADSDGDRQSDTEEWIAGTHPLDASTWFRVESFIASNAAEVLLSWQSATGRTYSIQALSSSALTWEGHDQPITNLSGTGGPLEWGELEGAHAIRLYRIAVSNTAGFRP